MKGYLGETIVKKFDTEFKDYKPSDWAIYFIEKYSQIDGEHHKQWVIDQVARILMGTEIIIKLAKWDNGHEEYRVSLDCPSSDYDKWVKTWDDEGYDYEQGSAP